MKSKLPLEVPAEPQPTRFPNRYLNEVIDYGGEPFARGDAILDMQRMGMLQPEIDRWLQGQELMARLNAQWNETNTKNLPEVELRTPATKPRRAKTSNAVSK